MRAVLSILLVNCLLVSFAACREVCYGELGCYVDSAPFSGTFQRPIAVLPEKPEKIATKFNLFTRTNSNTATAITYQSIPSAYNPLLKTVIVIHGFIDNTPKPWMFDIKNAILQVENANVIIVDWTKGNQFPYTQATANTQVVGAEIARLVNSIITNKGAKAENFHLVGHSLGAHISGYAGSRIKNLGRITGMDPAGPYFENTDPVVRLDPTDALYVDAIHSDGSATLQLGLGLMQPVGHVDFYPNGGKTQPNCPQTSDKLLQGVFNLVALDVQGVEDSFVCNHQAAVTYFIESIDIQNCKYYGYQCNSQDEYDRGQCISCTSSGCNSMGYYSSPSNDQGRLFLNTLSPLKDSFCTQAYRVKLVSSNVFLQGRGSFKLYAVTSSGRTSVEVLDDSATTFKPGSTEVRLVSFSETRIKEDIQSIFVSYTRTSNLLSMWLYDTEWGFSSIELFSGEKQSSAKFCPTKSKIGSAFVEFIRC